MNLKTVLFLCILTLISVCSFSQTNVKFQQLRGENVPTQSITYAIDQDNYGNIWIGSEEGVLKHNSQYYIIYNTYKGLPPSMSNRTKEVFVDTNGRVWIGLEKGICIYNKNLDRFELVNIEGDLNPVLINVITEDKENTIWVGAYNGLWKIETNAETKTARRLVANHNIQALEYFDNKLVIGTTKGLFNFDLKTENLKEISTTTENKNVTTISNVDNKILVGSKNGFLGQLNNDFSALDAINLEFRLKDPITKILKSTNNTLLIATDGNGIYEVSPSFKTNNHFTENVNQSHSLSSNGVYDMCIDRENILWVATYGGGVDYYNSNQLPVTNITHEINNENSIITNFTRAIAKDNNGNFWFGTKKGLSIWNPENNKWRHIENLSQDTSENETIILAIIRDDDYMWVGTYNEGLFKINAETLQIKAYNIAEGFDIVEKIYALHKDNEGNIWIGGIEKDLTVLEKDDVIYKYPIQQIKSISENKNGELLISCRQGVYKINHANKTFGLIEDLIPDNGNLSYSSVNATEQLDDNNMLIATNGDGLLFYNSNTKKVKKLTIIDGMPSDIVQGLVKTDNNTIWASTTKGIAKIKLTNKDTIIDVYDKKDGLASTEFNYGSYSKLDNNLLAFGGIDGVTMFNPETIEEQLYKPEIIFNSLKLSNKLIAPNETPLQKHINQTNYLELSHKENSLEIEFTGILHSAPSKVKYQWKLEGFDNQWSPLTNQNFATYTNLSPGDYLFKVKAFNKNEAYATQRELKINITTPWWSSTVAYIIYALITIALLYTMIHVTNLIVKKKNADQQIDFFNNVTHEIKTPLAILISSLDNVTENVDSTADSKERIKTTIKRINSLFEQMLNFEKVTADNNTIQDISKIDVYAQITQRIYNFNPLTKDQNLNIVFENAWSEDFYFNKESFDKILLNLISNAIKYSFENGKITINTSKTENGDLKIEIKDEGLGIPKDQQKYILNRYYRARNAINSQRPGTGLGLILVKKLLEKTGGSISFISKENKGTTFVVLLNNLKEKYIPVEENIENKENNKGITQNSAELSEFSDSKILIVEDNDELRTSLANTLATYFQVYEAANGNEGLETALQIFPDIILTDLIMPEMDGMQMAKQLKSDISLNHIPVFMLTVLQNSDQKLESIKSGISEYIEKPIDIKLLLAKLINTLKWQQKLRDKYVKDSDADTAELFRNKNDQEFLQNLEKTIVENIESDSFSVHDLSNSVGMSRTSLYMKLKNLVDLSPQDFIIHTKLKLAKNLLIKGDLSIKEVAYQSGFSNPKYFSTSFKKFYRMTPSGFIESLKKS
ncbi:hybrid sensor histidine kinase/response regulator transcription factor [Lacinutrix chionoecetis]